MPGVFVPLSGLVAVSEGAAGESWCCAASICAVPESVAIEDASCDGAGNSWGGRFRLDARGAGSVLPASWVADWSCPLDAVFCVSVAGLESCWAGASCEGWVSFGAEVSEVCAVDCADASESCELGCVASEESCELDSVEALDSPEVGWVEEPDSSELGSVGELASCELDSVGLPESRELEDKASVSCELGCVAASVSCVAVSSGDEVSAEPSECVSAELCSVPDG